MGDCFVETLERRFIRLVSCSSLISIRDNVRSIKQQGSNCNDPRLQSAAAQERHKRKP
jgi:hypothetical protein